MSSEMDGIALCQSFFGPSEGQVIGSQARRLRIFFPPGLEGESSLLGLLVATLIRYILLLDVRGKECRGGGGAG